MKSITVSVGYSKLLALTLPRNAPHFERVLVVTSTTDDETPAVCDPFGNVDVLRTDAFYEDGASLNKGKALGQGVDLIELDGWFCVWDADTMLPADVEFDDAWRDDLQFWVGDRNRVGQVRQGTIATPWRRLCRNPADYDGSDDWSRWERYFDPEQPGYCQFFHAADPALKPGPWFADNWIHAGGYDTDFLLRWPEHRRVWLAFDVLHLGEPARNWFGIGNEDKMAEMFRLRTELGFKREKLH